jgi:hypothetical protein
MKLLNDLTKTCSGQAADVDFGRRRRMNKVIAHVSLFGSKPGGDSFPITVQIGTPHQVEGQSDEWACPVSVLPLFKQLHDAHGGDSFQALCMAVSLSQYLLRCFVEDGGSLTIDGETPFPIEAYSFTGQ